MSCNGHEAAIIPDGPEQFSTAMSHGLGAPAELAYMSKTRFVQLLVGGFACASIFAACGSSSGGASGTSGSDTTAAVQAASGGNKTQFCGDEVTLDKATSGATQPSDLIPIFKANTSVLADFKATAPSEISAQADSMADAAQASITSGDASAFSGADLQADGKAVDAYCGLNSDGTPATTTAS